VHCWANVRCVVGRMYGALLGEYPGNPRDILSYRNVEMGDFNFVMVMGIILKYYVILYYKNVSENRCSFIRVKQFSETV
jgi:hypothetical protein